MDLKIYFLFVLAILILGLKSNASDPCPSKADGSDDISVIPIYGKCSPFTAPKTESWVNTVMNMAAKDAGRVKYLWSLGAQKSVAAPIASGQQVLNIGNYVVRVQLGTPGQVMYMVLDTSNDAAWVPCSGCAGCSAVTFSSKTSSSFATLDCSKPECSQVRGLSCPTTGSAECLFNQTYGGDSSFSATLVQDSLHLGGDVIPNFSFGCLSSASGSSIPPQGLMGLGRGPLSLISQSGSLYSGLFSYCLPSFKSYYFSGSLKLGPVGQPKAIRTTPLLKNPHRPSLYYVNLIPVRLT